MGVLWQRWLLLLLAQAAAGSLGGWLAGWPGALVAVLVGSWLWLWADCWQAHKLRRWLQSGSVANLPPLRGLWAVLGASARRWLQAKEKSVQAAEVRVQGVLHAFHASPNGVILLDEQGQIEWCNRMAQTHFGLQDPRDLGQKLGYLVRDPALLAYWQAHDFSESLSMDGSQGARLSVRVFPYGKGKHLLLAQDVTALEQAEAMRREFVANVSHEIRTPLTVLIGFVETLQTLELPAEQRQRYLHLMGQQAQRMHHLVQDLLTLSRLEGSPLPGTTKGWRWQTFWSNARSRPAPCRRCWARAVKAHTSWNFRRPMPPAWTSNCWAHRSSWSAPSPTSSPTPCATPPQAGGCKCCGSPSPMAAPACKCVTVAPALPQTTWRG